jgi:hypothetical protein
MRERLMAPSFTEVEPFDRVALGGARKERLP